MSLRLVIENNSTNPDPEYKTEGSSGFDIAAFPNARCVPYNKFVGKYCVPPNSFVIVPTGLKLDIPEGYEVQIRSRSGLASKGIIVLNSPGTIDSDYTGEIKVILYNADFECTFYFKTGERIAQGVLVPVVRPELVYDKVDKVTKRGSGGFGSTGQ